MVSTTWKDGGSNPKISVLLAVFNGGRFLSSSVNSILGQTLPDFEFIIIDDGSTDGTWVLLTAYDDPRIVLHKNEANMGLTHSLNVGLSKAKGDFIFRQDADDISVSNRFEKQLEYLETNPHIALLGCAVNWMDENGNLKGEKGFHPETNHSIRWKMLLQNSFYHSSVAIRRSVLVENNLEYPTDMPYGQDFDLWSRVLQYGDGANLSVPLVSVRSHPDQITQQKWEMQQGAATKVAAKNIAELGIGDRFSEEQILRMRRLDWDWESLTAEERFDGGNCKRILLSEFENRYHPVDDEWKHARRKVLRQIHRCIFQPYWDKKAIRVRLGVFRKSPLKASLDLILLPFWELRTKLNSFVRRLALLFDVGRIRT